MEFEIILILNNPFSPIKLEFQFLSKFVIQIIYFIIKYFKFLKSNYSLKMV